MEKAKYYQDLAHYYAASTFLHQVDAVVMLENMNDEWYWRQMLEHYRPAKYEFIAGTRTNPDAEISTGCGQCLKYKGYLNKRFFVCMDSDFRYLKGEDIYAEDGIMQTYTYSWENHSAYAERLKSLKDDFDFSEFLKNFSIIVHKGLIFMMFQEKNGWNEFTSKKFRTCLSQQYRKGDELNHGEALLLRIKEDLEKAMNASLHLESFDYESLTSEFEEKGVFKENAYLYVRGHNVYNILKSLGNKMYEGMEEDFEQTNLLAPLSFDEYPEAQKVGMDIAKINSL